MLFGLLLAAAAEPLARSLRPHIATPMLTGIALTAALCTGLVLSVAAVLTCAQLGPFPRLGHWSAATLRAKSDLPLPVGLIALLIVVACLTRSGVGVVRSLRTLILVRRASARMAPVADKLVILDEREPIAYSLAGSGGRIVVSTGMFAALSAPERHVLLAHEAAHLRHRHHLYLHLVRLATAANPLLRPVVDAVASATERWADEDAASEVGDRHLVARTLARAALASTPSRAPRGALGVADHGVVDRVRLLLAPPPADRRGALALAATAALLSWVTAAVFTFWANDIVQFAESVYLSR